VGRNGGVFNDALKPSQRPTVLQRKGKRVVPPMNNKNADYIHGGENRSGPFWYDDHYYFYFIFFSTQKGGYSTIFFLLFFSFFFLFPNPQKGAGKSAPVTENPGPKPYGRGSDSPCLFPLDRLQ
jgi:hypothetical protein